MIYFQIFGGLEVVCFSGVVVMNLWWFVIVVYYGGLGIFVNGLRVIYFSGILVGLY
jgi:hypothetical protein